MKLILNVDAITHPLTGIGQYALRLARGLRAHPAIEETRFYSAYRWIDDPEQVLAANRPIARIRRWIPFKPLALNLYGAVRSRAFLWQTRALKHYLLHSPNYILLPFDGPAVATIHDLSYLHYPQHHPRERILFMERNMPRTLAQAAAIICDSQFIRQEIISILGVPADKVVDVPLGVDQTFHPREITTLRSVLNRYHLDGLAYLLAVSTLEPRKNLPRLLIAYARLPEALRARHPLALVGAKGWLNTELERHLAPLERTGQLRRLGYVPQDDLPALYAGAHAFAYPSLYEGFGLPLLEAMASGIPALSSHRSSLPQVAGDAALLINPEDIDDLTAGLEHLLSDELWRAAARPRGLEQARRFSWERCVEETIAVYRRLLEEPRG
ncbi:MAG TPA: glycosyltransferase family 1 protein [Candidatus Competibacteraceae bacterium]|mgnify:FL=1|nr:glycosyltransferase family 1 protein [Candidatus Competibacteraceae bacterium]